MLPKGRQVHIRCPRQEPRLCVLHPRAASFFFLQMKIFGPLTLVTLVASTASGYLPDFGGDWQGKSKNERGYVCSFVCPRCETSRGKQCHSTTLV